MTRVPELSVVVPVFNEEAVLPLFHERLAAALEPLGIEWEVIYVDDGSRDASRAKLIALAESAPDTVRAVLLRRNFGQTAAIQAGMHAQDTQVGYVRLSRNFGHQIAVSAGIDHARGAAVVLIDADLQDPPEVIVEMVERWREGYDVVYGQRTERKGESAFKRATAALFYRLLRRVTNVEIPLDTGDFRLMSRPVVDALRSMPEHHRFVRGLVAWAGFRQHALPYRRDARAAGETKYPLRKMLSFALDATLAFSYLPLRIATALGGFVALASLAYAAFAVWARFVEGRTVAGWTSIMVALLFLGAVQLLSVGLIGEYLGRVYEEVKGRPLYLVRDATSPER